MQKDWTSPTDFTKAVKPNGKWCVDTILRLYRKDNPTMSRAAVIEHFKGLGLDTKYPRVPKEPLAYPTDFTKASTGHSWIMKEVYKMYDQYAVSELDAYYHFKTLPITPEKPFVYSLSIPAKYFIPQASGFLHIPNYPVPKPVPDEVWEQPRKPAPPWFSYLQARLGKEKAFLTVAYNLKEYYE